MNIQYFFNDLHLLQPEIVLSLGIFLLVLLDLMVKEKKVFAFLSIIIYAIAGFTLPNITGPHQVMVSQTGGVLMIDGLAMFFKVLFVVSGIFVAWFITVSDEMSSIKDRLGEFFTLLTGLMLGLFILASAIDLMVIYVGLELTSLSAYVLAGFRRSKESASEASVKYMIYGSASSGIMLFGISLIYGMTGTTNLREFFLALTVLQTNFTLLLAVLLVLVGIGYKISAVPFHFWAPDVYEGSTTPVTAFLSVASKAGGFILLIRFLISGFVAVENKEGLWVMMRSIPWREILAVLAILSMTIGNLVALWQDNLKRMLAYSSIAHAGYMLTALLTLSSQGVMAVLVYLAVYLFMNLGAFLIVILIRNHIKSESIDDYDGLGFKYPFYAAALTVFLISLTGLPPTAGFIGKLYLFMALVNTKELTIAVIALINSVVSLYYYVRVIKHMYLVKPKSEIVQETPAVSGIVMTAALLIPVLVLGVYFSPLIDFAKSSMVLSEIAKMFVMK